MNFFLYKYVVKHKYILRNLISILLICVIVVNSIMFGVVYIFLKGNLKKEFLSNLDTEINEIPVTKITSADIDVNADIVILENDELRIGDEFFDIYKTEFINGMKVYYCLNDKNEIFLDKAFSDFLSSNSGFSGKFIKVDSEQ